MHSMRPHTFPFALLALALFSLPLAANAQSVTYHYRHYLFTLPASSAWRTAGEAWTYDGEPFDPPPSMLVDGDDVPSLPPGVERTTQDGWNRDAIAASIREQIADALARDPGKVTIARSSTGAIVFDGVGLPGRQVDVQAAADLTVAALENDVSDVFLPVTETQPQITVDPTLQQQGLKEVVTVGESDFSNSPVNRRHNIAVGLQKFNGTIIPQGSAFSFDKTLGRVDGSTGYYKELVIKGDQTVPDFGGGLCQVSTTAYRGIWEYGFPILKRINHSYIVSHYSPQGTDATVYPPGIDMQFLNDSPAPLLIQTYAEDSQAYFIFYGTRDDRRSEIFGPFLWDRTPPPPPRTEYSMDVAPGATKKVGDAVPGEKALWYRFLTTGTGAENIESVYSSYEARPLYTLIGVAKMPAGSSGASIPTTYMEDQSGVTLPLQPYRGLP